ncbi:MAG: FGGY family carbohydrate kinase, partial [Planctomycetota bacterium]
AALSRELGRTIPAGFTGPKLRWSAAHEPDLWARVRRVLLPHDHVNLFLTGEFFTEVGDASGTGYLDPSS